MTIYLMMQAARSCKRCEQETSNSAQCAFQHLCKGTTSGGATAFLPTKAYEWSMCTMRSPFNTMRDRQRVCVCSREGKGAAPGGTEGCAGPACAA